MLRPDRTMDLGSLYVAGARSWLGRVAEAPSANDDIFGEPILWLDQAGGFAAVDFTPDS
jgi:hypothetical protein